MSDLIMKVKQNSAGAPDFSTAVEIEPKEYDPCGTCKHNGKSWHEEPCDGCCGNHSGYEPIGDLISRQDAIDAIMGEPTDAHYPSWYADRIKALPSAEPKTGKWMRLEREENVYDLHGVPTWGVNYMCDKCGFITTAIQDHFGQYKWCPSCGADMRGDEK